MAKRPPKSSAAHDAPADDNPNNNQETTAMNDTSDASAADTGDMLTLRIQGYTFTAPRRYNAGHVLSEVEADVLQQTFMENLRNNFANNIRKAVEKQGGGLLDDATIAQFKAEFGNYAANYAFNAPRSSAGPTLTPLEREALRVAEAVVNTRIAKKGLKVSKEDKQALVKQYAARDEVIAEARRRVEATTAGLDDLIGE